MIKNNDSDKLNKLLDWLEENIDIEHIRKVESLHLDSMGYKKVDRLPLSIIYPLDCEFKLYPYKEAFDNPEKMLYNELLFSFNSIYNSVKLKDYFPLHIRSNHGIGIIASMFGSEIRILDDNMPWVEPLEDITAIQNVIEKGIPNFNKGLGGKVIQTYSYYCDKLRSYPKCFEAIHISQPDLQGPFDITHLLVGTDIYYKLYDGSEVIHDILDVVTKTYIQFRKKINCLLTDKAGEDAVYVHGSIYGGKVVIKDDTAAANLSQPMYDEFSNQYNNRILKAFDGGSLHYCGQERPWHFESMYNKHLRGINFGNPEMHSLTDIYNYWSRKKVPIIWFGYNQNKEFLKEIYNENITTGISLAIKAEDFISAQEILYSHMEN